MLTAIRPATGHGAHAEDDEQEADHHLVDGVHGLAVHLVDLVPELDEEGGEDHHQDWVQALQGIRCHAEVERGVVVGEVDPGARGLVKDRPEEDQDREDVELA